MPSEKIEFTIQVPVEASPDEKARELFEKIRDLVKALPSQEEAFEGYSKILLSAHELNAIIERLDSEVQFRTSELFKSILGSDEKKGGPAETKVGEPIAPIFSVKATPEELGSRIRIARQQKGWSQLKLAQAMGLKSRRTVQNIENSAPGQTIASVRAALIALKVPEL